VNGGVGGVDGGEGDDARVKTPILGVRVSEKIAAADAPITCVHMFI
jgi:hypothetical protein